MQEIECKQCGGVMRRGSKVESSLGLQLIGVFVFILGIVLLFYFPVGTIIGIIMMIAACSMGYKKRNGWKCTNCKYFFDAA